MSYGIRNINNGLRRIKLILVLDSNEYIYYFDKESPLLARLLNDERMSIFINELIIGEVLKNITSESEGEFFKILFKSNMLVLYEQLPISLLQKYKKLGLKKGDIVIAAFCEHVKAEYLITENRHFLKGKKIKGFRVVSVKNPWS